MIAIRGVNKHFGTLHVLKDINLDVDRGQVVVVLGPSGSGKSTLCRTINRLETIDSGTIAIDGEVLPSEGRKLAQLRSEVGMVFQSFNLFAHKTILDNVMLAPLKVRKVHAAQAREHAMSLLERVGVASQADKYPAQLSGGQQQRVALARALAFRPSVLLLDEPLAALDAHIRAQLCDEIRDIQRASGAATLFVTHDQQEALMMADRVAVLHQGRLQQVDTPRGLYSRPANLMVARFVGHANLLTGTVLEPGRVQTVLGVLHADTGPRLAGAAISVLVRPESIHPDPAPDAPNRIPGAAGRVRFLGSTCRWDFLPASGAQSAVAAQSGLAAAPLPTLFCEGATVASSAVSLSPEALVILDDDAQTL